MWFRRPKPDVVIRYHVYYDTIAEQWAWMPGDAIDRLGEQWLGGDAYIAAFLHQQDAEEFVALMNSVPEDPSPEYHTTTH